MNSVSHGSWSNRDEHIFSVSPAVTHPRYPGLRSAVDRLALACIVLTTPVEIQEWAGDARSGSLVRVDATTMALHLGRGRYITLDVQRDLNGELPRETQHCILSRSGVVRQPDHTSSYNAY